MKLSQTKQRQIFKLFFQGVPVSRIMISFNLTKHQAYTLHDEFKQATKSKDEILSEKLDHALQVITEVRNLLGNARG